MLEDEKRSLGSRRISVVSDNAAKATGVSHVELNALDTIELTQSGKFAWLVVITAAIGGLLFGYDTGIISAVLVYINEDLGQTLNAGNRELITSITSGGAFVGASLLWHRRRPRTHPTRLASDGWPWGCTRSNPLLPTYPSARNRRNNLSIMAKSTKLRMSSVVSFRMDRTSRSRRKSSTSPSTARKPRPSLLVRVSGGLSSSSTLYLRTSEL